VVDLASLPELSTRSLLGGEVIAVDADLGTGTVRFLPPQEMANPHGFIQGGFSFAMLDDACGLVTYFASGERPASTIQSSLNFVRPVPLGEPLLAEAAVVHRGKLQYVLEATLRVESTGKDLVHVTQVNVFLDN
jgi:uncharacterized protein (TIGR00369 family)